MKMIIRKITAVMIFFLISLINFSFAASTSANIPIVFQGLTPIKSAESNENIWIDSHGNTWNVFDDYLDPNWYDYENCLWANAKTNNGEVYVWIPRFTYKIEGKEIFIKWSDGKVDDINDGYSRHPAFYFGEYLGGDPSLYENYVDRNGKRNELTGFWVKKDLFSENITSVSDAFESSIKMTSDTKYGFPQGGPYPHMTKASEWGALAYLTQAKGNNSNNSTTGNKTGVEIGGNSEYVAGVYGENSSETLVGNNLNNKKYRDYFSGSLENYKGYALTDTKDFSNKSIGSVDSGDFLIRSGTHGLFGYNGEADGNDNYGYRTSISIISEELTDTIAFFDTETSVVEGDYIILGIDFDVKEAWKFGDEPSNFFIANDDKKIIDLECIYEGDIKKILETVEEGSFRFSIKELNAEVIKMITPPNGDKIDILSKDEMEPGKVYDSGKYTLVVRVGGKIDGKPVFKPYSELSAKIIVNELNLLDSDDDPIRIGNIPNNKVRLNIFGEDGTLAIDRVVLKSPPSKLKYSLEEPLNLNGGLLTAYFGSNVVFDDISLKTSYIKDEYKNITSQPGTHHVKLQYGGKDVEDEDERFTITVSDTKKIQIVGQVKLGSDISNYSLLDCPRECERGETKDILAEDYIYEYMFNDWSTEPSNIEIKESSSSEPFKGTLTIPAKNVPIPDDKIIITASYIAPSGLSIKDQKREFIVGENFSFGDGKLFAIYNKNGLSVEREINLSTPGINVSIRQGDNEVSQTNLQIGKYDVIIKFGNVSTEYTIEVVNTKYELKIYSNTLGSIQGEAKDSEGTVKSNIISQKDQTVYYDISAGNTVHLKGVPEDGYALSKWIITDGLLAEEDLSKNEISFVMPEKDVVVNAEFLKALTVTFKIKEGQAQYGELQGELEQRILYGKSATAVTAEPKDNYFLKYWLNSDEDVVSTEKELLINNVESDEEYTAVFDNIWTVRFYNDSELFKEIKVNNGESAHISEIPEKYAYVFTGWRTEEGKDLSKVTSNMDVYAQYVPRINIEVNSEAQAGMIDAQITGTMIKEGTLQYLISKSPTTPEIFTTYQLDEIFTGFDGNWYNLENTYRNETIGASEDSSSLLTISSNNETEVVKFDYILSASEDSQLGITINGIKVVGPSEAISEGWNSFEGEVTVVDGMIKVGISYSQGENYTVADFAAIKNLAITRKWTVISNDYHLFIPAEFGQNYIHVKGTGSDDGEVYTKVSECINGSGV